MQIRSFLLLLLISFFSINIYANCFNMHVSTGIGWLESGHTDNLFLNSDVENRYALSSDTRSTSFVSAGIGYLWPRPFCQFPHIALNFGASAYYISNNLSGVNSPFVNVGEFDTLNFHATDNSYALLFEPKLIYTCYAWQPYILGGIGFAWNSVTNYFEYPSDPSLGAAPMPLPFRNHMTTNFAYDFGVGVQHILYQSCQGNLNFFFDYRYLNWGSMKLSTTPLQTTANGPSFGNLHTHLLNAGLEFQFA